MWNLRKQRTIVGTENRLADAAGKVWATWVKEFKRYELPVIK